MKSKKEAFSLKYKNITGINTCLTLKLNIFDSLSYNENIFLDNVDHELFYNLKNNNEKIKIIDYEIKQNFFSTSILNMQKDIYRKRIMKHDYKEFVKSKSLIEKLLYNVRIFSWGIKGSIKYKNVNYFVELLKK